jgi:hypothetical protein
MFSIDPRTGRRTTGRFTFNRDGGNDGGNAGGGAGEAERNLQNLLAKKNGDAVALAAQLLAENADLRAKRREAEAERDTLKAKVPTEGSVVLTGDDAKVYQDLTGKVPLKDLPKRLEDADKATTDLATLQKKDQIRSVATDEHLNADVLLEFGSDYEYVQVDVNKDGKTTKAWAVKDGDKTIPVLEHDRLKKLAPALTAQGEASGQERKQHVYAGPGTRDAKPPTPEELAAAKRATGEYTL